MVRPRRRMHHRGAAETGFIREQPARDAEPERHHDRRSGETSCGCRAAEGAIEDERQCLRNR